MRHPNRQLAIEQGARRRARSLVRADFRRKAEAQIRNAQCPHRTVRRCKVEQLAHQGFAQRVLQRQRAVAMPLVLTRASQHAGAYALHLNATVVGAPNTASIGPQAGSAIHLQQRIDLPSRANAPNLSRAMVEYQP
jgi:hypothetical protein